MADQLWELIHQMIPSEKSFFKKSVQTKYSKADLLYLKIFNALNAMPDFSDREFASLFGKGNQVSRMKTYLYELLLDSLIDLGSNSDAILRSKKSLNGSWVLFQKGLYGQSRKMVDKAIEQAVSNMDLYTEAEALSLKRLLNLAVLDIEGVRDTIREEGRIRELILEIQEFELLYYSFASFSFKKGNIINKEEKVFLDSLLNDPKLSSVDNCHSDVSRSYYHRIYTLYYAMTGEYEAMYNTALSRYQLLSRARNAQLDTQNFINTLNNLIEACLVTGRLEQTIEYNIELSGLKTSSAYFDARKTIRHTILSLQILIKTSSSEKEFDMELRKQFEQCFFEYERFVRADEKLEMLFLIITHYFNNRSFKDCKYWIRQYYLLPKSKTRVDLQLFIMIINIYMNFLSSDIDHLNYLIRNMERFERNEKILDPYERMLLDLIKQEISHVKKVAPDTSTLSDLKNKLSEIQFQRNEMSMAKFIRF